MGQKVHPTGFRLGVIKDWEARWFARGKKIAEYLHEDLKIRDYLEKRLKHAGLSRVTIERTADRLTVNIYTSRPGVVIGSKGREADNIRRELEYLTGRKSIYLNINEVRIPEIDAPLIAKNIAYRLEQRVSHRRAMKRAVELAMKMGAKGIRVQVKGRLGGAEIARKEWYRVGRVPLQTLRADIDYAEATAFTKAGTVGVKVWVYKGDVLQREEEEVE